VFEILIIFLLLVINGIFAMSEIALVSSRKARLQGKADTGSRGARIALKLLEEPEKFLSTVQIGITLVGIIAGAYGGEAFTEDLKPVFEKIELLKPYAEIIAFTSIVIIITYFSLVIGELVPKSIAMNNPEGITITLAPFMRVLSIITYPFVIFLSFSTKIFLKIFMIKEKKEPPVTEDELKYMIDTGSQHGVIEKQEREIMHAVFRFGDRKAHSLMTRRNDVSWIDVNSTKQEILEEIKNTAFTKYPVCNQSFEQIVGMVSVRDILLHVEQGADFDLRKIITEPVYIPEMMPALKVIELFKKQRVHLGLVVDEYGSVEGLITLHDLVENIIGDLPEFEKEEQQIIVRDDKSWLADAEIEIHEVKSVLKIKHLPGENSYTTLGGFIIYQLNKIPKAGDSFVYAGFRFEVVDMDGSRIDKVIIHKEKH
jgi:putative hemolysin